VSSIEPCLILTRHHRTGCVGRASTGRDARGQVRRARGLVDVSARWWFVGPLDSGDRSIGSSTRVMNNIYIVALFVN
jgi:hypothetical protein